MFPQLPKINIVQDFRSFCWTIQRRFYYILIYFKIRLPVSPINLRSWWSADHYHGNGRAWPIVLIQSAMLRCWHCSSVVEIFQKLCQSSQIMLLMIPILCSQNDNFTVYMTAKRQFKRNLYNARACGKRK